MWLKHSAADPDTRAAYWGQHLWSFQNCWSWSKCVCGRAGAGGLEEHEGKAIGPKTPPPRGLWSSEQSRPAEGGWRKGPGLGSSANSRKPVLFCVTATFSSHLKFTGEWLPAKTLLTLVGFLPISNRSPWNIQKILFPFWNIYFGFPGFITQLAFIDTFCISTLDIYFCPFPLTPSSRKKLTLGILLNTSPWNVS